MGARLDFGVAKGVRIQHSGCSQYVSGEWYLLIRKQIDIDRVRRLGHVDQLRLECTEGTRVYQLLDISRTTDPLRR